MSSPRTILLVGEGNFSFSAALALSSPGRNRITATCLQCQEEALRHEGTANNIQTIRDSGGEVLFQVDSTSLVECVSLRGRVFDRVVFNFPHCGRKCGVKKNRELLKNFFCSCVQVLSEDGEVHVALCNGQGGTPADHPMREWHNSWQAVSMAAEAGLILSEVRPFDDEKYDSYRCTGYRSQDKGFHVERGLAHVFTHGLPLTTPQRLRMEETVGEERVQYHIPAELHDYLHRDFLSPGSVHPVRLVQDFLLNKLTEEWSISMVTEPLPILLHTTPQCLQACVPETDHRHCYWIHPFHTDAASDTHTLTDKHAKIDKHAHSDNPTASDKDKQTKTVMESLADMRIGSVPWSGTEEREAEDQACLDGDSVCVGESGIVFLLRPSLLPQMEELETHGEEREQRNWAHRRVKGCKGCVNVEDGSGSWLGVTKDQTEASSWLSGGFTGVLSGVSGLVFKKCPISPWGAPAFHQLLLRGVCPAVPEPIKVLGRRLEGLLASYGVSFILEEGGLCLTAEPMGRVGRLSVSSHIDDITQVCVTVCLSLDLLATLLFSVPDWRLLWSRDPRFLKHFQLCPSPGQPFRPFSLYLRSFTYDISFWAGPDWEEEGGFYAVVREASKGTVEQVKLIDTFSHPDLPHTSYCYRLTYRSHTHALSRTQTLKLHTRLQTQLSTRLHVTIR